jgi:hypothetical protein
VFVCHCGVNIAGVVGVKRVVDAVKDLPGVHLAREELFACAEGSQRTIMETVRDEKLNRVVVAACTPRTHEPVFRAALEEAGLNPYLLEMSNIRDQCSWGHAMDPEAATARAVDQVRMAVARAARLEPLTPGRVSVVPHGLVIGGGAAGMACAMSLARQGVPTTLIEAGDSLGGRLANPGLDRVEPSGRRGAEILDHLRRGVEEAGVEVPLGTKLASVNGAVGDFDVELAGSNGRAGEAVPEGRRHRARGRRGRLRSLGTIRLRLPRGRPHESGSRRAAGPGRIARGRLRGLRPVRRLARRRGPPVVLGHLLPGQRAAGPRAPEEGRERRRAPPRHPRRGPVAGGGVSPGARRRRALRPLRAGAAPGDPSATAA